MNFSNVKNITISEGLVKQIAYNGTILWEKIIEYLKTVSGKIVSVSDAVRKSAESLEITFGPVQDLHNYDKPWITGNGKNLLNPILLKDQEAWNVIKIYADEGTILTASTSTPAGKGLLAYFRQPDGDQGTANGVVTAAQHKAVTQTVGSDGYVELVQRRSTGTDSFQNYNWQIEKGSFATSYEPYEGNICPISGHTEVVTYDDPMYGGLIEFNQLVQNGDFSNGTSHWTNNFSTVSVSDGVCELTLQAANSYLYQSVPQKVEGHKIYFVADASATASVNLGVLWGASMQSRIMLSATEQRVNFIATVGSGNTNLNLSFSGATNNKVRLSNVQLFDLTLMFGEGNEPTTVDEFKALFPKDYYAYNTGEETTVSAVNGTEYHTYTTALGRTVHGGTLDVVSGELMVDKGFAVFDGSETWTKNTRALNAFYVARPQGCKQSTTMVSNSFTYVDNVQDLYTTYGACFCGSSMNFNVDPTTIGGDTIEDWKAWLANNPLQVVYELATPQTYQLTPQTISLLHGNNNVWSDGEVELTYWGTEQSN